MKRFVCALMCVVIIFSLFACSKGESRSEHSLLDGYEKAENITEYNFVSGEDILPEGYENYAKGAAGFAFSLLAQGAQQGKNIVISPYSVSNALLLLANGSAGKTQKELLTTLAGVNMDTVNASVHYLNSRLTAFNGEDSKFVSAESLWLNDSFDVKNTFLQTSVNYYDAEVMRLDLSDSGAADEINGWISDSTDGEITDLIDDIGADTLAMIVNAVLMQDSWATPYTELQLKEGTFHGTSGDTTATYMNSTESYISTTYAEGFVKGFENLPLKFAAIIPSEDISVEEFVQGLTATRWQALLDSQTATDFCSASMPQFEVEYKNDLCDMLKALGVNAVFDANSADFSLLSNTGSPYVSKVTHEAFITVGPLGAKAGAATSAEVKFTSAPDEEPMPEVTLDRPFVFVIYDNESGIPVFTGIINNVG